MSMLASIHRLEFDKASEVFNKHPLTTEEIRQSCDDIKVKNECMQWIHDIWNGYIFVTKWMNYNIMDA